MKGIVAWNNELHAQWGVHVNRKGRHSDSTNNASVQEHFKVFKAGRGRGNEGARRWKSKERT